MKLLIKQRVFSWTDTYDVYDEEENPKYFVKAAFLTLGHQLHVYDRQKDEIMALMLVLAIDAANCSQGNN